MSIGAVGSKAAVAIGKVSADLGRQFIAVLGSILAFSDPAVS